MDFSEVELGPKMLACSERERKFAWLYVTGDGNATQAARDAGYPDNDTGGIRVRAHALMHRERVIEAIEEVSKKHFRLMLVPAIKARMRLIENKDHPDHARAVQSTLAQLGFGERTGVDVNVSGEVTVNHTDAALNDLRILKAMGASREMLLGMFGFSGLERYEKMLAASDAKLIEAKAVAGE